MSTQSDRQENIQKFDEVYNEFLEELIQTFPKETKTLQNHKFESEPESESSSSLPSSPYLDDFWKNNSRHFEALSKCNLKYFRNSNHRIVFGTKYKRVLVSSSCTDENVNMIWKYLHALYILCSSIKKIKNHQVYLMNIMEIGLRNRNKRSQEKRERQQQLSNKSSSPSHTTEHFNSNGDGKGVSECDGEKNEDGDNGLDSFFDNSLIGKLAKEISEEIDEKEIKKLGENPMGLIQSLMGGLPGFGGGRNDDEDNGSDESDDDEDGNQKSKKENSSGEDSSDPVSGIQKMVGSICKKLDNKMKSGELNHEQLFNEANQMLKKMNLGGGGDMGISQMMKMAGMFAGGMQQQQSSRNSSMSLEEKRKQLRKKLNKVKKRKRR